MLAHCVTWKITSLLWTQFFSSNNRGGWDEILVSMSLGGPESTMVRGAPARLVVLHSEVLPSSGLSWSFVLSSTQAGSFSFFPSSLLSTFLLHYDLVPGKLLPGGWQPIPAPRLKRKGLKCSAKKGDFRPLWEIHWREDKEREMGAIDREGPTFWAVTLTWTSFITFPGLFSAKNLIRAYMTAVLCVYVW